MPAKREVLRMAGLALALFQEQQGRMGRASEEATWPLAQARMVRTQEPTEGGGRQISARGRSQGAPQDSVTIRGLFFFQPRGRLEHAGRDVCHDDHGQRDRRPGPGLLHNGGHSWPGSFPLLDRFPFCLIDAVTLVGNLSVVLVIRMEPDLHKPMFLFLCMLAVNDLLLSTTILPKMLGILWRGSREIGLSACLLQMYLVHTFSIVDSAILLAMAFDRYVAICRPLHYATILSNTVVAKMGLAAAARGAILVIPCPALLQRLPRCFRKVIPHTYCEHMALVKLVKLVTCANTLVNRTYGISVALLVVGLDLGLIATSYAVILQAVFQLPSRDARAKALGTCAAHTCIILAFYVPGLFTFLTHRIGKHVPACIHILLASLYVLLPPMLNPLVYGVKTQQIRQRVLGLFHQGRKASL